MRFLLAAAALVAVTGSAHAFGRDPYADLARDVAGAAAQAGARSAQFLPLVGADGSISAEGRMLSARLLARLLAQKKLDIVLGPLPGSVLEPYQALLSAADGREFNRRLALSRPETTEVAIMGTYLPVQGRLKANIQLVDTVNGRILFAADADLPDDWKGLAELWPAEPRRAEASLLPETRATPTVASAIVEKGETLRDAPAALPGWIAKPAKAAPPPPAATLKAIPVVFQLDAPAAKDVRLVGGFLIHSDGRLPMTRSADGRWTATVYLNPGPRYAYHFLVDGRRTLDPVNPETRRGQSLLVMPAPRP